MLGAEPACLASVNRIVSHTCCSSIFTLRTKLSGAVYCNQSCRWVCLCVCLWVCYHDNSKLCALIHQTGFVGEGSDHRQLIKFWPSSAPGTGSAKIFGSALLQPVRSVCVSLKAFLHMPRFLTMSTFCIRLNYCKFGLDSI